MIVNIPAIESICTTSCFVILFFTTVYYWLKISVSSESPYTPIGLLGYGSATFCLTVHLVLRWVDSGHFPLSNLYESLIFLAWSLLVFHIYLEISLKTLFLGVLTAPALLCLVAFTDLSLPPELQRSSALVPALQSNWLVMHVTVMIASYAALLLGCFIALAYLILSSFLTKNLKNSTRNSFLKEVDLVLISGKASSLSGAQTKQSENESFTQSLLFDRAGRNSNSQIFLKFLDNVSYRAIGIGFCFLTLGILSGAVWANETWGNYWSWDPKETWAFITWLTFAAYLHSRLVGGSTGTKPAWIASFGFIVVWVCYLGVNLLGQGLHSYGFLQM